MEDPKLILYISMSLDGYLATNDDDLSWLSVVEQEGEDYGYVDFCATIDSYIVGRKTYDKILELTGGHFPQAEEFDCYVITRTSQEKKDGITFYDGDLKELIRKLKAKGGKDIYCDGGAELVNMLMQENLIDEYRISVIPLLLGEGKPLFKGGTPGINLKLISSKSYSSGLVHLHYSRS